MMYAKVNENRQLEFPTKPLIHSGGVTFNPSSELLLSCGYLPVIETEMPVKEGYYYTSYYEKDGNRILQKYDEHEIPVEEQTPQDYLWEKLIGL